MIVLEFVLPLVALGALVWGLVMLLRRRTGEPFTLATAVAAYAQLAIFASAVATTAGVATLVKVGLGYREIAYSYHASYYEPYTTSAQVPQAVRDAKRQQAERQQNEHSRENDLLQSLTLTLIGAIVLATHLGVARWTRNLPGGSPAWLARAATALLCVLCALVGLISGAVGVDRWLNYLLIQPIDNGFRQPFGDAIGTAAAFIPIWILTLLSLLRVLRRHGAPRSPAPASIG